MAEININDYIRDCDGFIVKVNNIVPDEDSTDIWYEEKILKGTWKSMIVNHSKNIIDLIEVGDIVNKCFVVEVDDFKEWVDIGEIVLREEDIETILTKEQYEANCYKVKEEY